MLRQNVTYTLADGTEHTVPISLRAEIAWEMRTGKSFGQAFQPVNVTAITGMLLEQLRLTDQLPEGVRTEAQLADALLDIALKEGDTQTVVPTGPVGQPATSSD